MGPRHLARTVSACPAEPSHLLRSQKLLFRKPGSARVHSVSPSSQCAFCRPSPSRVSLLGGHSEHFLSTGLGYPWCGLEFQLYSPLVTQWDFFLWSLTVFPCHSSMPCSVKKEPVCVCQWDCTASDVVTLLVYVGYFRVPKEKLQSSQGHDQHNPIVEPYMTFPFQKSPTY